MMLKVIVLISALLLSSLTAAENLTLPKAWELTLSNSTTHQLAIIDLKSAENSYAKSVANNMLTKSEYNQKQTELTFERAKRSYLTSKQNLQLSLMSTYMNVVNLEKQLDIRKARLEQSIANLALGKAKWEARSISDLELKQLELSVTSARNNVVSTENQLFLAKLDLESFVGEGDWQVFDQLVYLEYRESLNDLLEDIKNMPQIKLALTQFELAEQSYQEAHLRGDTPLDLEKAELDFKKAKIDLSTTEEDLRKSLIRSFQTLKQSEASYFSSLESLELDKKQLDITKSQVQAGVKKQEDLESAIIAFNEKELSFRQTLLTYLENLIKLENLLGRGEFEIEKLVAQS